MDNKENGKLFVGGLSWDTTSNDLETHFNLYGNVIDCVVLKNQDGRSRGFGFVTYSEPQCIFIALENGPHVLNGRTIDPKPCNPRSLSKPKTDGYPKVFLGGLPPNTTETVLRNVFSQYGAVMDVVIVYDQEKNRSRGFGFLSFEEESAADNCVLDHYINVNGKKVEIKRAEPKNESSDEAIDSETSPDSSYNNQLINFDWNLPQGPDFPFPGYAEKFFGCPGQKTLSYSSRVRAESRECGERNGCSCYSHQNFTHYLENVHQLSPLISNMEERGIDAMRRENPSPRHVYCPYL